MNKLTYRWEKVGDVFYVKVFDEDHNYFGVLSFNTIPAFYLFMETAMCGLDGRSNDAPVHVEYYSSESDEPQKGQVEVIYDTPTTFDKE